LRQTCLAILTSELGLNYARSLWEKINRIVEVDDVAFDGVLLPEKAGDVEQCAFRVMVIATGGTEHGVLKIVDKSSYTVLIAHRYYNSLSAALESISLLSARHIGFELRISSSEEDIAESINKAIRAYKGVLKLRSARLGLMGGVSEWLIYSRVDRELVEKRIGARLIEIPMEELIESYREVGDVDTGVVMRSARSISVPIEGVKNSLRLYYAVKKLINKYGLNAVSIKCFDLIREIGVTACLALSILNTEGFPASCEGDIPLLISMSLGTWATGKPVFMGNVTYVDDEGVLLAHCTAPLINAYELLTHFESGLSTGIRVEYPIGEKATLFRVSPDLTVMRVGVGVIKGINWSSMLCRTQVKVKLKNPLKILSEPMGNHYALVLGDHYRDLYTVGKNLDLAIDVV
jgi:L-fucose isomerase-like protein